MADVLSDEQLKKIKETFDFFDIDKDGKISSSEIYETLTRSGLNPTNEEIEAMMREADDNHNGALEFDEFVALMKKTNLLNKEIGSLSNRTALQIDQLAKLKQTFDFFDIDKDGKISSSEIYETLTRSGLNPSNEEIEAMMKEADDNHNGALEFDEFVTLMKKTSLLNKEGGLAANTAVQIDQLRKIRETFDYFDIDKDGKISSSEIFETLTKSGLNPTNQEIEAMMKEADENHNGFIEFDEFVHLMKKNNLLTRDIGNITAVAAGIDTDQLKKLKDAFDFFDIDKDGKVSSSEIYETLTKSGLNPTNEEIEAMMKEADDNHNGALEFEEFVELMKKTSVLNKKLGSLSTNTALQIDQLNHIRETFNIFDINKDGRISSKEIFETLTKSGLNPTKADVEAMMKEADENHNGYIEFNEFIKLINKLGL